MKQNELIEGKIYKFVYYNGSYSVICKCKISGTTRAFGITDKSHGFSSQSFWNDGNFNSLQTIEPASCKEKEWLLQSIKANKFIPLSEIKTNEYCEIYY